MTNFVVLITDNKVRFNINPRVYKDFCYKFILFRLKGVTMVATKTLPGMKSNLDGRVIIVVVVVATMTIATLTTKTATRRGS